MCWMAVCWDYVWVDMTGYEDIGPSFWITVGRESKDCEL